MTLLYVANVSLDGFVEDEHGSLDWSETTDEVFSAITDLVRPATTYLYGRRMYEAMAVWETDPSLAAGSPLTEEFARLWRAAHKVVWSRTPSAVTVTTQRTQVLGPFDAAAVRSLKAAGGTLTIGGADVASQAFAAGVVDEVHLFVRPVVLGGGKPGLPSGVRLELELMASHRFEGSGGVHLGYRVVR